MEKQVIIKWIEGFVIAILAIFAPIQSLLLTTGVMIFADLVTGIMAAKKQGQPITSAGLRRTLTKLFIYEVTLMLAFLTEHYMSDFLPFVKMASAMISVVELKSIYENLNVVSGNDLLKSLISKLGSENDKK